MKILIVTPYLPHPRAGHGTGVFMYGLLSRLIYRHEVTLVSFCDRHEMQLAPDLQCLPLEFHPIPRGKGAGKNFFWNVYLVTVRLWQLFRSIVLWQPYYVSKFRHPRMARLIDELTRNNRYDIVQIEFASMAQYLPFVHTGKTVLHEHDVVFRPSYRAYKKAAGLKRLVLYIEWCRWSKYEGHIARQFDRILSVTEQDKLLLEWLTGKKHTAYFPRGVDVPDALPGYPHREAMSVLFIGTFAHRPNADAAVWLLQEIFPRIQQRCPDAVLNIIGANPPQQLRSLAEAMRGVRVLGFVDDVDEYQNRCSLFVAPLRVGGGVKVKVLHAFAHGIPVVSTRVGVEGIDGLDQNSVLVGESAERIADHVCALLEDRTTAERIGTNGWEVVRRGYSWESIIARLEEIYSSVLDGNRSG